MLIKRVLKKLWLIYFREEGMMIKNITILCGKSACGKDMLHKRMVKEGYTPIVSYTTRPIRENETNGVEYHFVSQDEFNSMVENDELIEYRYYDTTYNGEPQTWFYGVKKFKPINTTPYIVILDIEGAISFLWEYGKELCSVVYIDSNMELRTERAKKRGSFCEKEWSRRLIADEEDFCDNNLNGVVDFVVENNSTIKDFFKNFGISE